METITDPSATYFYTWQFYDSIQRVIFHTETKVVDSTTQLNAIESYTFTNGIYKVQLRLTDTYGCLDTWEIPLSIADSVLIPNVFVPDKLGDYEIDPKDIGIVLHFQVFNRYGSLVFEDESPHIRWNGLTNSGKELNTGVYYYVLKATQGDFEGKYTQNGFIHLFR
jgi:gliding motility-associated-like protein